MPPPVTLVPYDDNWPALFAREKARLQGALAPYLLAVEHIGSTAIPGLAAKSTIDIMAGIYRLSDAPRLIERMGRLGYEYVAKFEDTLPERRYFRQNAPDGVAHPFHVHMVEVGSPFWERHLLFREWLRAHSDAAREYEALKRKLAAEHPADMVAYTDGKSAFIRKIEEAARAARASSPLATGGAARAPPLP